MGEVKKFSGPSGEKVSTFIEAKELWERYWGGRWRLKIYAVFKGSGLKRLCHELGLSLPDGVNRLRLPLTVQPEDSMGYTIHYGHNHFYYIPERPDLYLWSFKPAIEIDLE